MSGYLDPNLIKQYNTRGILFPIRVLTEKEASEYLECSNELEDMLGGQPKATTLTQMHLSFHWAYELSTHPKILDAVESILGNDIIIWATSLFPKHPNTSKYISWHQDAVYWGLSSDMVVTAWVALSPSTIENGCMRVVPGSHKETLQPHIETYAADNLLTRGQEIAVDVNEETALDIILSSGEMSLHHVKIFHGSNANQSNVKRVGFAIRYVSASVAQFGTRPKAILARGVDRFDNYDLVPPPTKMETGAAIETHKKTAAQFLRSVKESYEQKTIQTK